MTHKLDIFETLAAIDAHDMTFIDNLPEEQAKGFAPVVVMRWASAAKGRSADWYLMSVNERANVGFFDLYAHPALQYRLLASCGLGIRERHEWISAKSDNKDRKIRAFVSKYWPDANELEIDIILDQLREEGVLDQTLRGMGIQNDEAKQIKALFKN